MNDIVSELIVRVSNDKNFFEIISDNEITIENIKNKCKEKFNYTDEDIKNMNIWFIDEDNDKIFVNDNKIIKENAKEIDDLKYLINLKVEINDKIINQEYNNINFVRQKDDKNINKYENNILEEKEKNNEKIKKLEKKIEFLNNRINFYIKRINSIVSYYEKKLNEKISLNKLLNEKNPEINDNIKIKNDKKSTKLINEDFYNENIIILSNNEINYKDIEFIHNECNNCHNKGEKSIYKCPYDIDYFLCDKCYQIKRKKEKIHEHLDFFEINFPLDIIKIKEKEISDNKAINNAINSFYKILKVIFFDCNGEILITSSFKDSDVKNLKNVCNEMISLNLDPNIYFSVYQSTFINHKLKIMDTESSKKIIEKITLFLTKLNEAKQK